MGSCCASRCAPAAAPGFSYEMFFDTDVAGDDLRAEHGGVAVVIDPASQQHLKGRRSTTRTASRARGSRSATRTPSAAAAAVSPSPDRVGMALTDGPAGAVVPASSLTTGSGRRRTTGSESQSLHVRGTFGWYADPRFRATLDATNAPATDASALVEGSDACHPPGRPTHRWAVGRRALRAHRRRRRRVRGSRRRHRRHRLRRAHRHRRRPSPRRRSRQSGRPRRRRPPRRRRHRRRSA